MAALSATDFPQCLRKNITIISMFQDFFVLKFQIGFWLFQVVSI